MANTKKRYEAVTGINYVPDGKEGEVRREPGDRFDDLPKAAAWLVTQGHVIDHAAEEVTVDTVRE